MEKTKLTYRTEGKETLNIDLYSPEKGADCPLIVYYHGFKGFKDWGFVPYFGEYFTGKGFRFLAFNFSHNGIGKDPLEFTELRKFRDNTFSLELQEGTELIRALSLGEVTGKAEKQIGLLGHSRGGGLALLSGPLLTGEVQAICTFAAVSTYFRYLPDIIEQWRKAGVLDVRNARTGQVMQLGWNLHQDLLDHGQDSLNIEQAVQNGPQPLLIVHGEQDEAVSVEDAWRISEWAAAGGRKHELKLIPETGHTFGARHPFEKTNPELETALNAAYAFFESYLN